MQRISFISNRRLGGALSVALSHTTSLRHQSSSPPTPTIRIRTAPNPPAEEYTDPHTSAASASSSSSGSESPADAVAPMDATALRLASIGTHLYGPDYVVNVENYLAHRDNGGARDIEIERRLQARERIAYQLLAAPLLYRLWVIMGIVGGGTVYYKTAQADLASAPQEPSADGKTPTGSSAPADEKERHFLNNEGKKFDSTSAQDALMVYLGTLSVASGAALAAVYMPLVSFALFIDYGYVMWSRHGGKLWSSVGSPFTAANSTASHSTVYLSGIDVSAKIAQTSAIEEAKEHSREEEKQQEAQTSVTSHVYGKNRNLHEAVVTKAFPMLFTTALLSTFVLTYLRGMMATRHRLLKRL